jgi:hypothetical protein
VSVDKLVRDMELRMAAQLGREFTGDGPVAISPEGRYAGWGSRVAGSEVRMQETTALMVPFRDLAHRFVRSVRGQLEEFPDAMVAARSEDREIEFSLVRPVPEDRGRKYAVTGLTYRF